MLQVAPPSLQPELELLFPLDAPQLSHFDDDGASDVDSKRQRPGSASSFGSVGSDLTTGSGGTSAANSISRKEMERLAKMRSVKGATCANPTELDLRSRDLQASLTSAAAS